MTISPTIEQESQFCSEFLTGTSPEDGASTLKRKIFCLLDWKTAALPEVFFNRPFGLRPFGPLASFRFTQVAGCLPSSRLPRYQNDSQFFIPEFFSGLLEQAMIEGLNRPANAFGHCLTITGIEHGASLRIIAHKSTFDEDSRNPSAS